MKITLDTASLSRELFKLQGIVGAKSTIQMLQNALLVAKEDGSLSMHATDLELIISTTIPCEVIVPGRITLRARDLYDAVKNLRSDVVTLEKEDNNWVQLRGGTVKARFVGMPAEEFPEIPDTDDVQMQPLKTARLLRMIDRVAFSISNDDARPNLTGALMEVSDRGTMSMVSTDGYRLSITETALELADSEIPEPLQQGIIIPRKGLTELRRTADLTEEYLHFGIQGNNAYWRYGNTLLSVRLIDGNFPKLGQAMPAQEEERQAKVNRLELLNRIKYVSLFTSSKTRNIRLQFEDDTCTISAQDPEKGECEEKIPITYRGKSVRAGYNFKFLLDVLSTVDGEEVCIEVIDTLSPTVITELEGDDGDSSTFIVMPMRI